MIKKILFSCIVFLMSSIVIFAQQFGGRMGGATGQQNLNVGHFYGKVVDSKTNKGIAVATVQLLGNKYDTATKQLKKNVVLKTVISANNGDFSIDNVPVFGNFTLRISTVGYKEYSQTVSFGIKFPQGGSKPDADAMQNMLSNLDKDLGNIKLNVDATDLANVTVTASAKQQFEMGVDRKIYNVDKDISATGQTATEVMKNIPSVNVDIDGNVTLRNATPTLFIDDRPTTLTLDQIPSDIIDRVEIITNPSAKYDASGGTAGIINIVLKKNKKNGYNGGIRAGVDSRGKINTGGDINYRQGKVNFFANANYNQRKTISNGTTNETNFEQNTSVINSFVNNTNKSTNNGGFGFFRLGLDYLVDNRNTLSASANYNKGSFNSNTNQVTDSSDASSILTSSSDGLSTGKMNMHNFGGELRYVHNFVKNGHDISADFNYNSSKNDNTSTNGTYTYAPNTDILLYPALLQQTLGSGYNHFYTGQIDYENPLTDNSKLEAGVRAAIRDFYNDNEQQKFDYTSNEYVSIPSISNKYKYNDQVYAAYVTYSLKTTKWSYLLGLRAEGSNYTGTLLNNAGADSTSFKVKYPLSLFPSAFITYKIDDRQDLQINYSRRVNRPNFFQLMPFPNYSNYPNIVSIGNAGLNPEFTNSFELSYNFAYKRGANFLAGIFYKHTTGLITNYVDKRPDALADASNPNSNDSVYYQSFINANSADAYGLELTNKYPITKWWDLTLNGNLFSSKINSNLNNGESTTNELVSWFIKMNTTFKVVKGVSIQFSGNYQSKAVLPQNSGGDGRGFFGGSQTSAQGYNLPRYSFDFAIRKDWTWKNGQTGSLTLGMNDIFRTQEAKSHSVQPGLFIMDSERRRDPQVLRLTFSYRFGKFDTNLFKRKNSKTDQNEGMDMVPQQ